MTLEQLKKEVLAANLRLVNEGLVVRTFGNASGVDRERGVMVIKPSGVPYATMTARQMVTVNLETESVTGGKLRPSSDTPTHLVLYRAFAEIGGIVHTHSPHATVWAQARRSIPALGTTHADYFGGAVPCTRPLQPEEIRTDYERNTGKVIVESFAGVDPLSIPAVLVASHAPFTWGVDPAAAVENSLILEVVAALAAETLALHPSSSPIPDALLGKHFKRKHGPDAYYGQQKKAGRRTSTDIPPRRGG